MAITPQTKLRLLKVTIGIDNKNQLTFANEQAQRNYFLSLPYIEIDDISYIRKDSVIMFPAHIDNILEYNYVMYLNENYTNKWFYAFITNMQYENDFNTRILITTDVFQTWQFDITFKESFIEREMIAVAEDVPGANLIPEGLETGEFKVGGVADFDELIPVAIVAYSRNPYTDGLTSQVPTAQGVIANGIPNGMFFCICSFDMLQGLLSTINNAGFGESIVTIFTVPALALIGFNGWTLNDIITGGVLYWLVNDFKATPITKQLVSTPSSLDGYTPRNQKLRTYPYMYLGFNPANGSQKIYRYENFANGTPNFKICSEINQNPTVCFIPQNYRGNSGDSMQDIVSMQGYPVIGWITDYFNTWLAQNSEIINLQMGQEQFNYEVAGIKAIGNMLGTVANAGMAGYNMDGSGIANSLMGSVNSALDVVSLDKNHDFYIKQQMAQIEKQEMLPNKGSLGGSNATLLGYDLIDNNIFTRYTIKYQFAERIDKFFDMYGYLTNKVKTPNLNNRTNWNYVKTIGCNITGNIPQIDLQTIKNIFDNGVTLWHNTNTFLDYSQNNR